MIDTYRTSEGGCCAFRCATNDAFGFEEGVLGVCACV
jgi:hypothetical protein